jgi:C4-dicarboxylate-specific signal transduction histidine kinase
LLISRWDRFPVDLGRGLNDYVLDDAIRRVLDLVGNEIDDQGVTVDLSLASELPPVKADRILIEQVLLNLINNACEAVSGNPPAERRVSVITRTHADGVEVEVADNGCGLYEPAHIFDPFYSTKPGGLGMGLAIVRSIVNSHGGHVWAESAPARGASLIFTLPADGAAP